MTDKACEYNCGHTGTHYENGEWVCDDSGCKARRLELRQSKPGKKPEPKPDDKPKDGPGGRGR